METKARLAELSLEEKARLCVGMNFWMTQDFPEHGIPSLFLSDGPHGLRKQDVEKSDHLGINKSHPSVCYPPACLTACSWDRAVLERLGVMLGREAKQIGVDVLLGPGVNMKRSVLCGRNFEYFSEDPYLAGELAAAFIRGIQSNPVAACVKHFAANSQENRRKAMNSMMDERTLREIYLPAFETAVKKGGVKAVMTSYNKLNGEYPAQNFHLSHEILRQEWGFDGVLMTDWGAMDQVVPSLRAGLSLQMPGNDGSSVEKIVRAVKTGELSEADLDAAAARQLALIDSLASGVPAQPVTPEECHTLAKEIATESMVLLKNEGRILPLDPQDSIAVIGQMAAVPRYQGAGSSHVNPYRVSTAVEQMRKLCPQLRYAQGYEGLETSEELLSQAADIASACNTVVLFIGLPESCESESYDRDSISIPKSYTDLLERLAAVNSRLVVVLSNGSVIEMPWLSRVSAVLEAYLGGEASGEAICDILFGRANPSGKLAESFIEKKEDCPAILYMADGEDVSDRCEYREGIFIGYRYYEKKKIQTTFPFGHGLSYTDFTYSQLSVDKNCISDDEEVTVTVEITNTGSRFGKEIAQLYVRRKASPVPAPIKELRGFSKIGLAAGETGNVEFRLGKRAFAYFNEEIGDWYVPRGEYEILVGASSADIRCQTTIVVTPRESWHPRASRNTILKDILDDEKWFAIFREKFVEIQPYLPFGLSEMDLEGDVFARALLNNMTLHSLASYVGAHLTDEDISELVEKLNAAL